MRRPWTALDSIESPDRTRCVDIFVRADGSFGFEEFRRDIEDGAFWRITGNFSTLRYASREEALAAGRRTVPWLAASGPG